MCGIVGIISATPTHDNEKRKFFTNALVANAVRGDDGTGVFIVPHDSEPGKPADWVKNDSSPYDLIYSEQGRKRLSSQAWYNRYRAIIGHNRAATRGQVSQANSHPFVEGPITLVHNGGLNTYDLKTPMAKLPTSVQVDSHALTHNLALHPTQEVLETITGSFALVWHDARDMSINIFRNDERPLAMAACESINALLLCSEADMMRWIANRHGLKLSGIYTPKAGTWLRFLPERELVPEVTQVRLRAVPTYSGGQGHWILDDDGAQKWIHRPHGGTTAALPAPTGATSGTAGLVAVMGPRRPTLNAHERRSLRKIGAPADELMPFDPVDSIELSDLNLSRVTGFVQDSDGAVWSAEVTMQTKDIPHSLTDERWMVWPLRASSSSDVDLVVSFCRKAAARVPTSPTPPKKRTSGGKVTEVCGVCHRVVPAEAATAWVWDSDVNSMICLSCASAEKQAAVSE